MKRYLIVYAKESTMGHDTADSIEELLECFKKYEIEKNTNEFRNEIRIFDTHRIGESSISLEKISCVGGCGCCVWEIVK